MVSKKEVAVFSLSEIEDYNARIEFRRNTFYFYSHRNNPDEKPIILKPAGIRELINQLKIGKVVAEKEEVEIESGKNQDGEIYNALLNHVKHWDIRYVVNSYQKEVYHWLKLFAYYDNDPNPKPCKGGVILHDIDIENLQKFVDDCLKKKK